MYTWLKPFKRNDLYDTIGIKLSPYLYTIRGDYSIIDDQK